MKPKTTTKDKRAGSMKPKTTTKTRLTETASVLKQHSTLAEVLEHLRIQTEQENHEFSALSNIIAFSKYHLKAKKKYQRPTE